MRVRSSQAELRQGRVLVRRALATAGLEERGVHFHDLRHTGNHLAAATGASTRERMARMGHSTLRAALIYQHATRERDRVIADAVSDTVTTARTTAKEAEKGRRSGAKPNRSGTDLARGS